MPQANVHGECAGHFVISTNKRGVIARFPNLITDAGLNRMGDNVDWLNWCQVGSGSAAPANGDTSLQSRIAGSNTVQAQTGGAQPSAPYYVFRRKTFRFAEGVAAGNLSEVGVGWATTGSLFSRALILDSLGDPTTLTILADEILDVAYEFRFYPKTTDDTGSVTLTGNLAGTYDWIFRAANVNNANAASGWEVQSSGTSAGSVNASPAGSGALSGNIGAITASPAGTVSDILAPVAAAYVASSLERTFTASIGLDKGNVVGGIRSLQLKLGIGYYQIQFDPAIPKTSSDLLTLNFKHTWARRP